LKILFIIENFCEWYYFDYDEYRYFARISSSTNSYSKSGTGSFLHKYKNMYFFRLFNIVYRI
jgi:hypothetical protein